MGSSQSSPPPPPPTTSKEFKDRLGKSYFAPLNSAYTYPNFNNMSESNFSIDLTGADLSGSNFTAATLGSFNLTRVILTNSNLTNANFSNVSNLTGIVTGGLIGSPILPTNYYIIQGGYLFGPNVNLSNIVFPPINLINSTGTNIDFSGSDLTQVNFTGTNLSDTNFTNAKIVGANFTNVNLTNCKWEGFDFTGRQFNGTNFTSMDLSSSIFNNCVFTNCNFTRVKANKASFEGSTFSGCNFSDAVINDLAGVIVTANAFFKPNFNKVTMTGCNLNGANFSGVNLQDSSFNNCSFSLTDLQYSNLSNVNFVNSTFATPRLIGANLTNTIFNQNKTGTGIDFSKSNLNQTSISNISNTTNGTRPTVVLPAGYFLVHRTRGLVYDNASFVLGPNLNCKSFDSTNLETNLLTNLNLSSSDFTGANLNNITFRNVNFSNAIMVNTIFNNILLNGCIFDNILTSNLQLSGSNGLLPPTHRIVNRTIVGPNVRFSNINFASQNLNNFSLANAKFSNVSFFNAQIFNLNLSNSIIQNLDLSNVDCSGVNFTNADISGVNINQTRLLNSNLTGTAMSGITGLPFNINSVYSIHNSFLIGPNLKVRDVTILNLDMSGVNLQSTKFTNVKSLGLIQNLPLNLSREYTIHQGYLIGETSNLSGLDLKGKDFSNLNLTKVNFQNSNLQKAYFRNCIMNETNFIGANLTDVVSEKIIGKTTFLPQGWKIMNGFLLGSYRKEMFMMDEYIQNEYTLYSFGYKTFLSPNGNTLVVLDSENHLIYFYERETPNTLSPFKLSSQYTSLNFKTQYIFGNVNFSEDGDICLIGILFCDAVSYILSGIEENTNAYVFQKTTISLPKMTEKGTVITKQSSWAPIEQLPFSDLNNGNSFSRLPQLNSNLSNKILYTVGNRVKNDTKIYSYVFNNLYNSIANKNTSSLILPPSFSNTTLSFWDDIMVHNFTQNNINYGYVIGIHMTQRRISLRSINNLNIVSSLSMGSEVLLSPPNKNIISFGCNQNLLVCYSLNEIFIYDLLTLNLIQNISVNINDLSVKVLISGSIVVLACVNQKKIIIYDRTNNLLNKVFEYQSNHSFAEHFSIDGNGSLVSVGEPKYGNVYLFAKLETGEWSVYQVFNHNGFSDGYDIDKTENTLIVTNTKEKNTRIYENITDDLSLMKSSTIQIPQNQNISSFITNYTYNYSSERSKFTINSITPVSSIENLNLTLHPTISPIVTKDGNMIFSIYQTSLVNNGRIFYRYFLFSNEQNNQNTLNAQSSLIYNFNSTQQELTHLVSDRDGDILVAVFGNTNVEIVKRVRLNEKDYRYVCLFRTSFMNLYSIITNQNNSTIENIFINQKSNIIVFQTNLQIIIFNYLQEIIVRQTPVLIRNNITNQDIQYNYESITNPLISYLTGLKYVAMDSEQKVYLWDSVSNSIQVFGEEDNYQFKISQFTIPSNLNLNQIKFYPDLNLFTFVSNNKINFSYYDNLESQLISTNTSIDFTNNSLYEIVDNNLILYNDNQHKIEIYRIVTDVKKIQNLKSVDLILNLYYSFVLSSTNLIKQSLTISNRNQIFYSNCDGSNNNFEMLLLHPLSNHSKKFVLFKTFYENRVNNEIYFNNQEFSNNVKRILTSDYIRNPADDSNSKLSTEEVGSFKFYGTQKHSILDDTNNSQTKNYLFTFDTNSNAYFTEPIKVSNFFNPQDYLSFQSVLDYMNQVNSNLSNPMYVYNIKTYVAIDATVFGGTNFVRYQFVANSKEFNNSDNSTDGTISDGTTTSPPSSIISDGSTSDENYYFTSYMEDSKNNKIIFLTREYTIIDTKENWTSFGKNFDEVNQESVLKGKGKPLDQNLSPGTYAFLREGLPNPNIFLKFNAYTPTFNPNVIGGTNYTVPKNVNLYILVEVEVKVFREKYQESANYLVKAPMEYGIYTDLSVDGTVAMVGSNIDTISNFSPLDQRSFTVWYEQSNYASSSATIGGGTNSVQYYNITYNDNYPNNIKYGYDPDLIKLIDLGSCPTIPLLESYIQTINSSEYGTLIHLTYNNYYALAISGIGGIAFRTFEWLINDKSLIKTDILAAWGNWTNYSPHRVSSTASLGLKGQRLPNNYVFYNNNPRHTSLKYEIKVNGGTEGAYNSPRISYLLNIQLTFTEAYFQIYCMQVFKYSSFYFFVKDNMRWLHLNSLAFKNTKKINPLNPSKYSINSILPENIITLSNQNYVISRNKVYSMLKNNAYNYTNAYQTQQLSISSSNQELQRLASVSGRSLNNMLPSEFSDLCYLDTNLANDAYAIFQPNEEMKRYGAYLHKSMNTDVSGSFLIGSANKFRLFSLDTVKKLSDFVFEDKMGYFYLKDYHLYNSIPEFGVIKKYDLIQADGSTNSVNGIQLDRDLGFRGYGNKFAIFDDIYLVTGTKEGKVVIKNMNDKSSKTIIDSGNKYYTKFGSEIQTGDSIYINSPEQNKLFILKPILYYE